MIKLTDHVTGKPTRIDPSRIFAVVPYPGDPEITCVERSVVHFGDSCTATVKESPDEIYELMGSAQEAKPGDMTALRKSPKKAANPNPSGE